MAFTCLLLNTARGGPLQIGVNQLKDHIDGGISLTAAEIAGLRDTIIANKESIDENAGTIADVFDLVSTYDSVVGPLWVDRGPIDRRNPIGIEDPVGDQLALTMSFVMLYIMDYVYDAETLALHEELLNGFKFGSVAHFPGDVAPPAPGNVHTVTLNASYPDTRGWERQHDEWPARRATGCYLAPGTVVSVTVPSALVGKGFEIRVGAHTWDHEEANRPRIARIDRATLLYPIISTTTKLASPYGGGIYIEVPPLIEEGIVNIDVMGAVRSPLFSMTSYHATTEDEWLEIERKHPAPWADVRTDKYMVQVPTTWIYAMSYPRQAMEDWDLAIDVYNDLMGFPRDRGKETIYNQVDLELRGGAFYPGYPMANYTEDEPTGDKYGGNNNSFLIKGPAGGVPSQLFHEAGHAFLFPKFWQEQEVAVNLPHVAIMHQAFGEDLDYAFASSRGEQNNPSRTLNNTAIAWMLSFNFSPREQEITTAEKQYQLKGHAKFVDIARLFGWEALERFYKSYVDQYEATDPVWDEVQGTQLAGSKDSMILWHSIAAGKDVTPLIHFWGMPPDNPTQLANDIANEGLQASPEIYELLRFYKTLVPADNAAFQSFATNWWNGQPSTDGFETEREHARQWDATDLATGIGEPLVRPNGEIFDEAASEEVEARVQEIIDLYFPAGNPDPSYESTPSPSPLRFVIEPHATSSSSINMRALSAMDFNGPIRYWFVNTTLSKNSGWIESTEWTDTELDPETTYRYRVRARNSLGNLTDWSEVAEVTTLPLSSKPPVKIFILSGQSNMLGHGESTDDHPHVQQSQGTLSHATTDDPDSAFYQFLVDDEGDWIVRDDVFIRTHDSSENLGSGGLTIGYGAYFGRSVGPELGFGHIVGDHYDEDVLIIKAAWGGKSLAVDFRPPSSGGTTGPYYNQLLSIIDDVINNLVDYVPGYEGQGFEILGFGWHQGWNDRSAIPAAEYETNMANFISDIRNALGVAELPFVIATTGMDGGGSYSRVEEAQLAIADTTKHPEFEGNVAVIDTKFGNYMGRPFAYPAAESPHADGGQGFHWHRNGKTHIHIGKAMGEAILELIANGGNGNTFADWISGYPGVGELTELNDDADGDGYKNGVENFFGTDPSVSSVGISIGVMVDANTFRFTHPQSEAPSIDLIAAYTWSKDLETFYGDGVTAGGTTVNFLKQLNTPSAGFTTVTATVSGSTTNRLFTRLEVTQE